MDFDSTTGFDSKRSVVYCVYSEGSELQRGQILVIGKSHLYRKYDVAVE